jgi:imidazolonepropionase-like amidohydrolase
MEWDGETTSNLRRILDRHAASLTRAHELGVTIIAGSDAGSYGVAHGLGFLYELELMGRAGLPPPAVLQSATGAGSKRLAYREKLGRVQTGFLSRFILTRHSPLEGIRNLQKPRFVMFDGAVFESDENLDLTGL